MPKLQPAEPNQRLLVHNSQLKQELAKKNLKIQQLEAATTLTTTELTFTKLAIAWDSDEYFPDVLWFYGDPKEWEPWQLHLEMKFQANANLFPDEQEKISYIRDRCKSRAFDIIQPAFTRGGVRFKTSGQMLEVLQAEFRTVDVIADAEAAIHSPTFRMMKGEAFDEFLGRFDATVAPLRCSRARRISILRQRITPRMQNRLPGGQLPKKYKKFVDLLRSIDDQMHHGGSSDLEDDEDDIAALYYYAETYPTTFLDELKREGRCCRCLKTGHELTQKVPCRGGPENSYDDAKEQLEQLKAAELPLAVEEHEGREQQ